MEKVIRLGILAAGLTFCVGCGNGGGGDMAPTPDPQELHDSPDYQKQMLGETAEE